MGENTGGGPKVHQSPAGRIAVDPLQSTEYGRTEIFAQRRVEPVLEEDGAHEDNCPLVPRIMFISCVDFPRV
jgi:hypothetical protein